MRSISLLAILACLLFIATFSVSASADEPDPVASLPMVDEARVRAKLLHETLHGTLQVVHRDLFNDDGSSAIPSRSLEDVFEALKEDHNVEVEWLVVDTDVVNVDHVADEDFEKEAVKALKKGEEQFERVDENTFHYVGRIHLGSQCLKCHVKLRTDTNPRTAGLAISMPIQPAR